MFERFTDRARRVVVLAQEDSRMLHHNYIGTEHILLGLIHEGEGVAAQALDRLNISLDAVRSQVEEIIGLGAAEHLGHIPFTPRAKKVLELSLREALQLGHNYIGTEHILLGLIREGEGVASQVLQKLGADLNQVRQQVISILGRDPAALQQPPPEVEGGTWRGRSWRVERGSPAMLRRDEHEPERWPICPRCNADLREAARYRVQDVIPEEEPDGGDVSEGGSSSAPVTRRAAFLYCAECGRVVAANLLDPDVGDALPGEGEGAALPDDDGPGDADPGHGEEAGAEEG